MDKPIIGIIGGMGSYATADFFKRLLDALPAEKEWERPRIIIDNRCDMPSRVRAILYNENRDELVAEITKSMRMLIKNGASHVILACNTSHVFLDEVYTKIPEAKPKVIHIIDELGKQIKSDGHHKVFLLASEGTIETKIYSNYFGKYGIEILYPEEKDFSILRDFIEAVKQNEIDRQIADNFVEYINSAYDCPIILGCTELPVIYAKCKDKISKKIYDPLDAAINKIKEDLKNEQ